jgi:hypothetical protein
LKGGDPPPKDDQSPWPPRRSLATAGTDCHRHEGNLGSAGNPEALGGADTLPLIGGSNTIEDRPPKNRAKLGDIKYSASGSTCNKRATCILVRILLSTV